MGCSFRTLSVLVAAFLCCRTAVGQQPALAAPCESTSFQPAPCPCVCPPPAAPPPGPYCAPPVALDREPPLALQLMLGQELGVRAQVALFAGVREAVVVEGFYGGLYTDVGSSTALGAGGRWLLWNHFLGPNDAIVFGPGVDVFFGLNHRSLILLTPSVDVGWAFKLAPRLEWETGLDIGLGIGVSGQTDHGHSAVGDITPLISLYTGLRF